LKIFKPSKGMTYQPYSRKRWQQLVEGNAPLARTVLTPVETAMEDMYVAISHHILKL